MGFISALQSKIHDGDNREAGKKCGTFFLIRHNSFYNLILLFSGTCHFRWDPVYVFFRIVIFIYAQRNYYDLFSKSLIHQCQKNLWNSHYGKSHVNAYAHSIPIYSSGGTC